MNQPTNPASEFLHALADRDPQGIMVLWDSTSQKVGVYTSMNMPVDLCIYVLERGIAHLQESLPKPSPPKLYTLEEAQAEIAAKLQAAGITPGLPTP